MPHLRGTVPHAEKRGGGDPNDIRAIRVLLCKGAITKIMWEPANRSRRARKQSFTAATRIGLFTYFLFEPDPDLHGPHFIYPRENHRYT